MVTHSKVGVFQPNPKYAMGTTATGAPLSTVPKSVRAALANPNWHTAMQLEYDTLIVNKT
jgi:hypothetical protein